MKCIGQNPKKNHLYQFQRDKGLVINIISYNNLGIIKILRIGMGRS